MNVLDQIMGAVEAAEMWGLSPDRVKGLCQNDEVLAKKIGNSWVLVKDQPNPKGGRKMKNSGSLFMLCVNCAKILFDENAKLSTDFEKRLSYTLEVVKSELGEDVVKEVECRLKEYVRQYQKEGVFNILVLGGKQ